MKTLIIIPAYNEEASLGNTVAKLTAAVPEADYLVVNDGSTDGTVRVCRDSGYPFLDLPCNLGLAGAFQAGIKYAHRHEYDCAIQFDADGQHLPQYICDLEKAIETCDIAIGSRFVDHPKGSSLRMFGSSIIQGAIKLTTGQVIRDPTSGMRAFNRRMIKLLSVSIWVQSLIPFPILSVLPMLRLLRCQSRWPSARQGKATLIGSRPPSICFV